MKKYNNKDMHSIHSHCSEHTSLKADLDYFWRKKMDESQCIMDALHEVQLGHSISGTDHEAHIRAFTDEVTFKKLDRCTQEIT